MPTTTEDKQLELIALDFIAAMTYQTHLNVQCLNKKVMHLEPSKLKDVVIYFVQNQKDWTRKLMSGLERIGLKENMERDLNGEELDYYCVITEFGRQTHDMAAAANIMEAVSKAESISEETQHQIINLLNQ